MSDIYSSRQAGSRQMSSRPMSSERSAFTLVELMVVIGIIGLLVAIALPAFNQARISVRKATSKATITAISTGLEQLRADEKFGGTYPPSYAIGVENPYGGTPLDVCGASLAVWGTVGTDMLGTAGFRDPDNCGASWQVHFADLYKVNGSTPVYPRNSFVDVSKVKVTQRVANGNFEIPTKPKQYLNAPAFLDAFDQPILYYRANLGQPQMVCNVSTNDGIYSITDNEMIARPGAGLDFGAGTTHFSKGLGWPPPAPPPPMLFPQRGPGQSPDMNSFAWTVYNPAVTVWAPHNPETFILLSAGPDGIFGTQDDIANFETNK